MMKFSNLLFVFLFIFYCSSSAFALPQSSNIEGYLYTDALLYTHEALCLELSNANSSYHSYSDPAIHYGNPIPAYHYVDQAYELENTILIPIFFNDALTLLAHVFYLNGEIVGVELTDDLVEELDAYIDDSISLISNLNSVYVCVGQTTELLKSYEFLDISAESQPVTIINNSLSTDLSSQTLCPTISFDLVNEVKPFDSHIIQDQTVSEAAIPARESMPNTHNLHCTIIQQNGQPICWAGVVASIGLALTGTNYTAEYVSNYMFGELRGGNTATSSLALQELYGINTAIHSYAPYFSQIQTEIYYYNHPIYVRVYGTSSSSNPDTGINHALFIDGYQILASDNYTGMLSVGDPNYSYFRSIFFTTDRVYPYALGIRSGYIDEFILIT